LNRRHFLRLAALGAAPFWTDAPRLAAAPGKIDVEAILNDPEAPVGGNADGNVTIVAFLDYNCPYCRKTAADLERFVTTDGKTRLVYKDWPILAVSSVYGARLALGAKYQGRYRASHAALMALRGPAASEDAMRDAVKSAGLDMARLDSDLAAHDKAIGALIKRNDAQAKALGLAGTPSYLIGPFLVASALDYDGFGEAVRSFRERIGK
jgi:protein-disulfide isomerase